MSNFDERRKRDCKNCLSWFDCVKDSIIKEECDKE